jgi:hypothetical protein
VSLVSPFSTQAATQGNRAHGKAESKSYAERKPRRPKFPHVYNRFAMHYHLTHIVPGKAMHGLHGYQDVIDAVQWGLQELGHEATYGLNAVSTTATNIVFGAQVLPLETLAKLPPETIVYNFQQLKGAQAGEIKPQLAEAARRFSVWDYSEANAGAWQALGAKRVSIVPVGYAPVLERVPRPASQDIDVLLYGLPGDERLGAFNELSHRGLTTVFFCGLYGKERDELIGRSKVVLNVNLYDHARIFEIVRVSYLLANRKAVVADLDAETHIEQDIRRGIRATTRARLVEDCLALIENDAMRADLEEAGFAAISRRDIRKTLASALKTTDY